MAYNPPPGVEHSICRNHKGLVRQTGDVEGKQYWCPIGRELWTYTKTDPRAGFRAPLNYPKVLV